MTVKAILDEKGRNVHTVSGSATLMDAARMLTEHKIGAVVVIDDRRHVLGILSERDIVRAIANGGSNVMDDSISGVMTRKVVQCSEDHTVDALMEIMTNGRFRHIPVEVDGVLGGIISIGDVVRRRMVQIEREAEEMKAYITS